MSVINLFVYLCSANRTEKMFSKACEYGIRSMVFIATRSQQEMRVGLTDIALEIDSPVSFTSKILQKLVKSKLLVSLKGPTGGFEISKKNMDTITLAQIVSAIDGDDIYKGCGLGLRNCNESKPCPLHFKFKRVRDGLEDMLEETSLTELTKDISKGITFLKRK